MEPKGKYGCKLLKNNSFSYNFFAIDLQHINCLLIVMEGYIAQIIMFAGNFAPANWAFCQGQIISIAENEALFALIGTTYGGNGQTTFALPDFRGRMPVGTGSNALGSFTLGEMAGISSITLTSNQMPAHTHPVTAAKISASSLSGALTNPVGNAYGTTNSNFYADVATATDNLGGVTATTGAAGSNAPVNIQMPYLGMNYVICLFGIFPSRN
jgi:microcystin-dependent protein